VKASREFVSDSWASLCVNVALLTDEQQSTRDQSTVLKFIYTTDIVDFPLYVENKKSSYRPLFLTYVFTCSVLVIAFYPRDAMLSRVIAIATCLSVRPSVRPSRAGIVSNEES